MPNPQNLTTFQFYYKMLLNKLTGGKNTLLNVTDEQMEAAVNAVMKQIKDMGPDPQHLDDVYETLTSKDPDNFQDLRPKSDQMPNGESRYTYAEHCRKEVMKGVARRVRQAIEWHNAAIRIGVADEQGNFRKIPTRWMFYLMKLDGSPESLQHNEAVAALGALGTGMITKERYLQLRRNHYINDKGLSSEQASASAQQDLTNAAEFLYKEVSDRIEEHRTEAERCREAAFAAHNGDFSKFEGGMEEAFGLFYTDSASLAFVGGDILDFLKDKFAYSITNEQAHTKKMEWIDLGYLKKDMDTTAEQVSNPYFAVVDPKKYETDVVNNKMEGKKAGNDLVYCLLEDKMGVTSQMGKELDQFLKGYGLSSSFEMRDERMGDYHVFSRDGRSLIVKIGPMTENQFVTLEVAPPERLAKSRMNGMRETSRNLLTVCRDWNRESRTSRPFEAMRTQLELLSQAVAQADLRPGWQPTQEQITKTAQLVETLHKKAQAYLLYKETTHTGSRFERQRIQFANDVLAFAEKYATRMSHCVEHYRLTDLYQAAEKADGPHPEWKNDPKYAGMSSFEHTLAVEKERIEAETKAARERVRREQEERERPMRDAKAARDLAEGSRSAAALDGLFRQQIAPIVPAKSYEAVMALTEELIQDELGRFRTFAGQAAQARRAGNAAAENQAEQNAFDESKLLTAGYVIEEMVRGENEREKKFLREGGQGEFAKPIHTLVSNGKVKELAQIIAASANFIEAYAERLSDISEVEALIADRSPGSRTRRDAFAAGSTFLDNIALARKAAAERAAQQEPRKKQGPEEKKNPNPVRREEGAKEPPRKKQGHEEKENPNRIHEDEKEQAPVEPKMEAFPEGITRDDELMADRMDAIYRLMGETARKVDLTEDAVKRLDQAIQENLNSMRRANYDSILSKYGKDALALSAVKVLVQRAGDPSLAAYVVKRGSRILQEGFLNSAYFKEEIEDGKINPADRDSVSRAIEGKFGTVTAIVSLKKARVVQTVRFRNRIKKSAYERKKEEYHAKKVQEGPQKGGLGK